MCLFCSMSIIIYNNVDKTKKRERIIVHIRWQCPFEDRLLIFEVSAYQLIPYRSSTSQTGQTNQVQLPCIPDQLRLIWGLRTQTSAADGHQGKFFTGCRGANEYARLSDSQRKVFGPTQILREYAQLNFQSNADTSFYGKKH